MHATTLKHIGDLQAEYHKLRQGKQSLLTLLEEAELPESVYNSNAIENSTLTLDETERILHHQEIPPYHSQREVFEAINLARVTEYLNTKIDKHEPLVEDLILLAHRTLLSHIRDEVAGRFRHPGEYVRVGRHIAPPPEHVPNLIHRLVQDFHDAKDPLQSIVNFHLAFEHIHPFCDGNGRVGRALLNFQLKAAGYPPIIIRNKEKKTYYAALSSYDADRSTKAYERIIAALLKESFHKRIAYLRGDDIVALIDIGKEQSALSPQSLLNAAKKQALPAFRERGHWKVGKGMFGEWLDER